MDNLVQYLNDGVDRIVKQALKSTLKNPLESAFVLQYANAAGKAAEKRLRRENEGLHVPPYLIASISAQCNLFCAGCYARSNESVGEAVCKSQLSDTEWKRIFNEANELGVSLILLAGGEPMLRRGVLEAAAGIPEVLFPVFTNGTLIDDDAILLFHKNRNLVPIISLEGDEKRTDARRGGGVYALLTQAMVRMKDKGIVFGASITVTKENLDTVTARDYINDLRALGCQAVIFVEYVAVSKTKGETEPDGNDRARLLSRQTSLRNHFETMIFVAFPGDEEALGGCLAAGRGFIHINPTGGAEPCPFSPFSDTSLKNCSLKEALGSPLFKKLHLGGLLQGEHLGGCVLHGKAEAVKALLK